MNGRNAITIVSMMVLVGTEVFAVAIAAGWALAGLFDLGDRVGPRPDGRLQPVRRLDHAPAVAAGDQHRAAADRHGRAPAISPPSQAGHPGAHPVDRASAMLLVAVPGIMRNDAAGHTPVPGYA